MANVSPFEVVTIPYVMQMEECAPVQNLPHVYYELVDVHYFTNYTFILQPHNHHIITAITIYADDDISEVVSPYREVFQYSFSKFRCPIVRLCKIACYPDLIISVIGILGLLLICRFIGSVMFVQLVINSGIVKLFWIIRINGKLDKHDRPDKPAN